MSEVDPTGPVRGFVELRLMRLVFRPFGSPSIGGFRGPVPVFEAGWRATA